MLPKHILVSLALFLTVSAIPIPSSSDAVSTLMQDIGSAVGDLSADGNGNSAGNGNKNNGDGNGNGNGDGNGDGNEAGNSNTIGSISLKRGGSTSDPLSSLTEILGSAVGDLSEDGNGNAAGNNNAGNGDGNGNNNGNGNGDNNSAGNGNTIGSISLKRSGSSSDPVSSITEILGSAVGDLSGDGNANSAGNGNVGNGDYNGNGNGNKNGDNNSAGNDNTIGSINLKKVRDLISYVENLVTAASDVNDLSSDGNNNTAGSNNSDNGNNNGNNNGNDNGSNNSVGNDNTLLSNDPITVRRQDIAQQLKNSLEGQFGSSAAEDVSLLPTAGVAAVTGILNGAVTGNDGTSSRKNKRQFPIQGEFGDILATEILGDLPKKE